MPSAAFVKEFVESMPPTYRVRFGTAAQQRHAALSYHRGLLPANLGLFEDSRTSASALCVVADDRPGLLASISAALVLYELDVVAAEAFTRRTPAGRSEAVDIFWVQPATSARRGAQISADLVDALLVTLNEMLREGRPRSILPPKSEPPAEGQTSQTVVRFLEGTDGTLSTLEIETDDRSGLLLALSRALYDQRVQIVSSEVSTERQRVLDRFSIIELDDSPISPSRRLQIQVAILGAIEATYSRASR